MPGKLVRVGQVIPLPPLPLLQRGTHAFNFFINNELKHTIDLDVGAVPPPRP